MISSIFQITITGKLEHFENFEIFENLDTSSKDLEIVRHFRFGHTYGVPCPFQNLTQNCQNIDPNSTSLAQK